MLKIHTQFALAAAVVVGGLALLPAKGVAKEFQFQGGGEPFGSSPPVGMTMEGKDFKHPKRLTGFSVLLSDVCPDPSANGSFQASFPIWWKPSDAKIHRNKKKDLTYFKWSYDLVGSDGTVFESYSLIGGQHHKNPRVWRGKVFFKAGEAGIEFDPCTLEGADADGYVHWEAELL